jgi:hypothetical protein
MELKSSISTKGKTQYVYQENSMKEKEQNQLICLWTAKVAIFIDIPAINIEFFSIFVQ